MKLPIPYLRVAAALSLASGLMIGCQDFLGADKNASGNTPADETGTLSLSIKNDSACLGQWHAILDARAAGHPDSASEASFLASCVMEAKPDKDGPKPPVPPPLRPDSGLRCKWIVSQIEGGRESLTVSYRKYCPEDCHKLAAADSASHAKLCRDPEPHPGFPPPHPDSLPPKPHQGDSLPPKPPVHPDSGALPPPKPAGHDSVCADLKLRLGASVPGTPGRSELEAAFKAECMPPLPPPPAPDCDAMRAKLALLDSASVDYVHLSATLKEHCPAP